ncbi:MAG: response regulator [Kiritimatiellae bacterium]|nr:response regulator [Kiritimatiellia bacterium]
MQAYLYSIVSALAIAVHLILNSGGLLSGRQLVTVYGRRYSAFVKALLAYYAIDAAWGVFAGLGWTRVLYADTVLYFFVLALSVLLWCRAVTAYLGFGKWPTRILSWFSCALVAFNVLALAANSRTGCFFRFDAAGAYANGPLRDLAFVLLVAFNALLALFVFAKARGSRDAAHRRHMMVFQFCLTMTAAVALQVLWPLLPLYALGCLLGSCYFHVHVVVEELTELHRTVLDREREAQHAAELKKALDRARAAEKAKSLFFSIASHDIRTPLNAILGYSELLQYGIESPAERDRALESIRASGTTLLELVNDVLDLAKMDEGKIALRPEPLDLHRLTDEVFASFRLVAAGKGIELANRTEGVPAVLLDAHRFRQILFNLVGNAVKFTDRGSVTVAASLSGTDLEVAVSDTGCGIPSDMLSSVLDPFVQVRDPSHSADRDAGSGLGLSICKRLSEAMGGALLVESKAGKGSTFRVHLAGVAVADGTGGGPAPEAAAAAEKRPRHVLVVDDSPVNRAVLAAFLKRAGVGTVDRAADGAAALAELDAAEKAGRPHDFVFTDFWMPNMNGTEFVERLRADPRFARLPVFAVTADTEIRSDGRTALFTGILWKPLTYAKLVETFSVSASPVV